MLGVIEIEDSVVLESSGYCLTIGSYVSVRISSHDAECSWQVWIAQKKRKLLESFPHFQKCIITQYTHSWLRKPTHRTEKKTAFVHFTTIPCKPNIGNRHRKPYLFIFFEIRSCNSNIVCVRIEVRFCTSLGAFLWLLYAKKTEIVKCTDRHIFRYGE